MSDEQQPSTPSAPPRTVQVTVAADHAGQRLDGVVADACGISRQKAKELIDTGKVRAGRKRVKKGEKAEAGLVLTVELPQAETPVPQPELPLVVLHEDRQLLAFDKPAGVSMHPLEPGEQNTLANAVIARYPDIVGASHEERCPGLVHRLDRDTSGVVLWARTAEAFGSLRRQFEAKTVEKRYHALVDGFVEGSGELAVPLAHDPADARKMLACPYPAEAEELKARPAVSRYRALGHGEGCSLVEIEIPTGVMHQIRAHFAFVGYPVLNDELYGGRALPGISRHLLHASSIGFQHPATGERTVLKAPLPADFLRALQLVGIHPPT